MATLQDIYRNQLGRAPDAGGLAHYQAQIASGRSIDDIRKEIRHSPEAKSRGVGAYASSGGGGGGGGGGSSAPAAPKYTSVFANNRPIEGLPIGGRGYNETFQALRAAANQRRDLFSGSAKSNLNKLGIKEGYSFTGGAGKVLVDTVEYGGSGSFDSGILNIYKDAAMQTPTGGGESSGGGGGGNDGTTGPVDPVGPITSGGSGSSGPSLQDLIDTIANMSQPVINIPPPPVYTPPPSFAAVGQAASANPGVRIRRSRSRAQGTNILGTNFFNRGTRNTLRISGLNV